MPNEIKNSVAGSDKLRELVLYICAASEGDEAFGSIKLNKLLFYSDFLFYIRHGTAITGQEYQKLPQGPAPRLMLPLLKEMQSKSQIAMAERNYYGLSQKKPLALREANLNLFTVQEIDTVNQVLRNFKGHTGMEISEQSHNFIGWQLAEEGETIPYSSALLHKRQLSAQEEQWAQELDLTGVAELLRA